MDRCRSCGAPIMFKRTFKGRRMPLDVERDAPPPNANVLVSGDRCSVVAPGEGTHTSHFATCPNASKHRRKRKE